MKGKFIHWLLGIVLIIAIAAVVLALQQESDNVERDIDRALNEPVKVTLPTRKPTIYNIRYEVGGTAKRVDLTISNRDGNTEQFSRKPPWNLVFTAPPHQHLYVSVQNDTDKGQVNCRIYQDNKLIEQAQSSGAYVIASCSALAGD